MAAGAGQVSKGRSLVSRASMEGSGKLKLGLDVLLLAFSSREALGTYTQAYFRTSASASST